MPVPALRFETTWTLPFPVTTTGDGTALTICRRNNDPYLAFVTQTTHDDEVVYLHTFGGEAHRHATPLGQETIKGMAYDPFRRVIWCSQSAGPANDTIIAFDPDTELQTATLTAPLSSGLPSPRGLACNGFFVVRGGGPRLELWTTGVTGLSASPWSYTFVDEYSDEIVVIGPLGDEIAISSGVGAAAGMRSVAFDYINHWAMDSIPQVWGPDGTVGDPGTIHHPYTPWNPEPWGGRHRLYVANEVDQTIYAGYLTLQ